MAALVLPSKDPDDVLDYAFDWTERLDGDRIVGSVFSVNGGDGSLRVEHSSVNADLAKTQFWLSGGTTGTTYSITNRVNTAAGRKYDQTAEITIVAR
jgi:hypothetical protein